MRCLWLRSWTPLKCPSNTPEEEQGGAWPCDKIIIVGLLKFCHSHLSHCHIICLRFLQFELPLSRFVAAFEILVVILRLKPTAIHLLTNPMLWLWISMLWSTLERYFEFCISRGTILLNSSNIDLFHFKKSLERVSSLDITIMINKPYPRLFHKSIPWCWAYTCPSTSYSYILKIGFICVISLTILWKYTLLIEHGFISSVFMLIICNYSTDIKLGNTSKTFRLRSIFGHSI